MERRDFIKSASAVLFIPGGFIGARTTAAMTSVASPDHIFYDERFSAARGLAVEFSGDAPLTPVSGDMTGVWNAGLSRECAHRPLVLRGVTTESFYFCLKGMAGTGARMQCAVTRLSRYLYRWEIRTLQEPMRGATI